MITSNSWSTKSWFSRRLVIILSSRRASIAGKTKAASINVSFYLSVFNVRRQFSCSFIHSVTEFVSQGEILHKIKTFTHKLTQLYVAELAIVIGELKLSTRRFTSSFKTFFQPSRLPSQRRHHLPRPKKRKHSFGWEFSHQTDRFRPQQVA